MKLASTSIEINAWIHLKEKLLLVVFSFTSAKKKKRVKLEIDFDIVG